MITTEKLICAFKSNIEYAEGDKRCLTIKKDCVSIISLWYEESFENRKICFKKWMGIPFNVYYEYKYKDNFYICYGNSRFRITEQEYNEIPSLFEKYKEEKLSEILDKMCYKN